MAIFFIGFSYNGRVRVILFLGKNMVVEHGNTLEIAHTGDITHSGSIVTSTKDLVAEAIESSSLDLLNRLQKLFQLQEENPTLIKGFEKKLLDKEFLKYFYEFICDEFISIVKNHNIDIFEKISFLGFLFAKANTDYADLFYDIHNFDVKKLNKLLFHYESEIAKHLRFGNTEYLQYILGIYVKFLDFVSLVSTFHEMDLERRLYMKQIRTELHNSVRRVKNFQDLNLRQCMISNKAMTGISFGDELIFRAGRIDINTLHTSYIDFVPENEVVDILSKFNSIFSEMYGAFNQVFDVNFMESSEKKQTLVSAFLANITTFMLACVHKIETVHKQQHIPLEDMFHHHSFYVQILDPFIVHANIAFENLGINKRFILPKNFDELKQECAVTLGRDYKQLSGIFQDDSDENLIFDDVINILSTKESVKFLDLKLAFVYEMLPYINISQENISSLIQLICSGEKNKSYHIESLKLKIVDVALKKLIDLNKSVGEFESLYSQVEKYLSNNKKNSIILNIYARIYLTLSYCYSHGESTHQKAANYYFIYEGLSTSARLEGYYQGEVQEIFQNIFGTSNIETAKKDKKYSDMHEKFVQDQWLHVQQEVNQISGTNLIEKYERAMEVLSDEFFFGMVKMFVVNNDVDSIPVCPRGYSHEKMDISLSSHDGSIKVLHSIVFQFPNNYKNNFYSLHNEETKKYVSSQIVDIFSRFKLYVSPIYKKNQNDIVFALNNKDLLTFYFQPIQDQNGNITTYECLLRFLDRETKMPLSVLKDEKGTYLGIEHQIEIANHLGIARDCTKQLLKLVFMVTQENQEYEFNINLSYDDIMSGEIQNELQQLAKIHGGDLTGRIIIELLENKIHDEEEYYEHIKKFEEWGYKVAVDDFGSEYNNLGFLDSLHRHGIKIYKLKIDRVVVKGILIDANIYSDTELSAEEKVALIQASEAAKANIRHFVHLTEIYGITGGVVAEYVENENVQQILLDMRVRGLQGYHIGKPNSTLEIKK